MLFFKGQVFVMNEIPHGPITDLNAALGQFRLQLTKRNIRFLSDPLKQPSSLTREYRIAVAAHLASFHAARFSIQLRPSHNARDAHREPFGDWPT